MPVSFGSILSVARTALTTQQSLVSIASNNIANAQTPGYTRQQGLVTELPPQKTTDGVFGSGVTMLDVSRLRDALLDESFRTEAQNSGYATTRSDMLSRVEDVFQEPSDNGLSAALDKFYNAWQDLANNPTSLPAKGMVQQTGGQLASMLNTMDERMQSLTTESVQRLTDQVSRVNQIGRQIADLNGQIVPIESGGKTAAALRDQRDQLVDELSNLSGAQVVQNRNGSIQVVVAGQTLVDEGGAHAFNAPNLSGRQVTLTFGKTSEAVHNVGGSIGALLQTVNTDISGVRTSLDNIATALVNGVNRLHRMGWSAAGDAANLAGEAYDPTATPAAQRGSRVNFFDTPAVTAGTPVVVTARDIRLSAQVAGDPNYISAGVAGWDGTAQVPAPGDNSIALAIAGLRGSTTMVDDASAQLAYPPPTVALPNLGGKTIADSWTNTVGTVGASVSQYTSDAKVADALKQQADQRRQSVSGVNMDEELISLMRAQQAYQAASKVINTVDQMTQTLLGIGG